MPFDGSLELRDELQDQGVRDRAAILARRAAELLRRGWCRGYLARGYFGLSARAWRPVLYGDVSPTSWRAREWCLLGAVDCVTALAPREREYMTVWMASYLGADLSDPDISVHQQARYALARFNDERALVVEDVVELLHNV